MRGVVQGSKGRAGLDELEHLVGDDDAGGEILAAVDYAVADGADLVHGGHNAVLRRGELVHDGGNGLGMGGHGDFLIENALALDKRSVLEVAVDADALAEALGQNGLVVHVEKLILEGGASGIDNQNFHSINSFRVVKNSKTLYHINMPIVLLFFPKRKGSLVFLLFLGGWMALESSWDSRGI